MKYWCLKFSDGSLGAPTTRDRAYAIHRDLDPERKPLCSVVCLLEVEDPGDAQPEPQCNAFCRSLFVSSTDPVRHRCLRRSDHTGPHFFSTECIHHVEPAADTLRPPPPDPFGVVAGRAEMEQCPNGLTPDGPVCPRCGGDRAPSGVDGGSWVHFQRRAEQPTLDESEGHRG